MLDTKAYERVMVSLRRYFGVTVVDCETLPAEVARTALSAAQARVLTAPATLEGIASTHAVLQWMRGLPPGHRQPPPSSSSPRLVPHTGARPRQGRGAAAGDRGERAGAAVRPASGGRRPHPHRTARPATREAATRLAAEVFQLSQKSR